MGGFVGGMCLLMVGNAMQGTGFLGIRRRDRSIFRRLEMSIVIRLIFVAFWGLAFYGTGMIPSGWATYAFFAALRVNDFLCRHDSISDVRTSGSGQSRARY